MATITYICVAVVLVLLGISAVRSIPTVKHTHTRLNLYCFGLLGFLRNAILALGTPCGKGVCGEGGG